MRPGSQQSDGFVEAAAIPGSAAESQQNPVLSIIVPVFNEVRCLDPLGERLSQLLAPPTPSLEILIVDGGSQDGTAEALEAPSKFPVLGREAREGRYRLVRAKKGRALQMNAGAHLAQAEVLVFLHADTTFGPEHAAAIVHAVNSGADYGCFCLRLRSQRPILKLVGGLISLRSRVFPSATGDQAIFIKRQLFFNLGGYKEIALCEDLDLIRRARSQGEFACLPKTVETSARRWEERGVTRTIFLMWGLRIACHAGVDPTLLKKIYEDVR